MMEVVCAALCKDGLYLIAQRNSAIAMDIWEFPGGKIELGETQEEAVIREVKEELNLDVAIDGYLCEIWDDTFTPVVHVYAYLAHILKGELTLHVHKQYRWVTPEELSTYTFQKADAPILKCLQKKR